MWCVGHSVMLSVYRMKLPITRRPNSAVLATYSTLLQLKHFPSKIWHAVSSLSVLFLLSSVSNRAIKFPNFLFPFYTNSHDVVKCFIFFGRTTRIIDIIISSFISNRNDLILSLVVRNSRVLISILPFHIWLILHVFFLVFIFLFDTFVLNTKHWAHNQLSF